MKVRTRFIIVALIAFGLFAVVGGRIITPIATGILPGIVRMRVLALASVVEAPLTLADVRAADELFVTSSLRGVVPVTRLDGESRVAGPVAARIARAYGDDMHARAAARLL